MKILITAVGHRTEHWTDYFETLAAQPDVELTLLLADVSPQTQHVLRGDAGRTSIDCRVIPHLLGEAWTGHMASIMFRPRALRQLRIDRPDVVHVIGEAGYLSTWQVLHWSRRSWPGVPVSLYAAQNIVIRFPPPFPWLERRAYESVTHAVPITPAALDVLRTKGFTGAASIVPLGVDTRRFTPAPEPATMQAPSPSVSSAGWNRTRAFRTCWQPPSSSTLTCWSSAAAASRHSSPLHPHAGRAASAWSTGRITSSCLNCCGR